MGRATARKVSAQLVEDEDYQGALIKWQDGDLHQVWNLVLACYACHSAKRDRPPLKDWMPWLERRGESLITSHHLPYARP